VTLIQLFAFFSLYFCNWIVMHGMEDVKLFSMSNINHIAHCLSWFQSPLSVPLWLMCGGSKECVSMCQVSLFGHQTESNFYSVWHLPNKMIRISVVFTIFIPQVHWHFVLPNHTDANWITQFHIQQTSCNMYICHHYCSEC